MSEYCNNVNIMTVSEVVKFIRNTKALSLEQLGIVFGVSKAAAINSNSQLYKQAGNAVTVNVVEEIGKHIMSVENGV